MKSLLLTILFLGTVVFALPAQPETASKSSWDRPIELLPMGGPQSVISNFPLLTRRPSFPGGITYLNNYLTATLRYPESALNNSIEGEVWVRFEIDPIGMVREIKVIKGLTNQCNKEVIRTVEEMPRWEPALQYGMPVNNAVILAVRFRMI